MDTLLTHDLQAALKSAPIDREEAIDLCLRDLDHDEIDDVLHRIPGTHPLILRTLAKYGQPAIQAAARRQQKLA